MPQESKEYAPLEGGVSIILAYRVKQKKVLIIGGGFVAASRVVHALQADALITLISEEHELCPELKYRIETQQIHWENRRFVESDLDDDVVMVLADQVPEADKIYQLCKQKRIPVNVADIIEQCDFWFMSIHRDGPLQVAVSSNGKGPRIARAIRQKIANAIPKNAGKAIEQFSILRAAIRKHDPPASSSSKRMSWLIKIVDSWSLQELTFINHELQSNEKHEPKVAEDDKINEIINEVDDLSTKDKITKGAIQLVGAGPGDPDLLTMAAYKAIQSADLIVADRLVSQEIISLNKTADVKVASPKIIGKSDGVQDELNEWCLKGLKEGKKVIRLKVGDPFLYGRAGEEIEYYRHNGYEPKVIPGISSALGAPSAALLPITHRGQSDQVFISTGNIQGGIMPSLPNYYEKRTLILLMAVGKANEIQNQLLNLEYPSTTPCTFIEAYSLPNERVIRTTLDKLGITVKEKNIEPPVCLYIGNTCHFGM
ncbi:uroporphyrin-III C-m [Neoconidiobolus thromboides FSU 785]|nr:uroporphyrin-III C-m [Neoconidiobolus thromboides FSU 785]